MKVRKSYFLRENVIKEVDKMKRKSVVEKCDKLWNIPVKKEFFER